MAIWILLMVLLTPVTGFETSYQLNSFNSPTASTDCSMERDRIARDMEKAYPGDASFRIECREKPTPISSTDEKNKFEVIIKTFAQARYPKEPLTIKASSVQILQNDAGSLPIVAIQLNIFRKSGGQAFIVLIKDDAVMAWIDEGEVDEETEDAAEVFSHKDEA
jgi:hypothetical protein